FFSLKVSAADGAFLSRKDIYFRFPLFLIIYKIQTNDSSLFTFSLKHLLIKTFQRAASQQLKATGSYYIDKIFVRD
ncbi:MAG: hypothetical protein LBS20_06040, partial [Prevotella sp.]|nr:hypothetical protein [Prevotella sp.]